MVSGQLMKRALLVLFTGLVSLNLASCGDDSVSPPPRAAGVGTTGSVSDWNADTGCLFRQREHRGGCWRRQARSSERPIEGRHGRSL